MLGVRVLMEVALMLKHVKLGSITLCLSLLGLPVVAGSVRADHGSSLSKQDLRTLNETAKTPEEHERVAQHYDATAAQLDVEATRHEERAASSRAYARTSTVPYKAAAAASVQNARHCEGRAEQLQNSAKEARALAADHREMAKKAQLEKVRTDL
jgi:hypothetical protein